MSIMSSPNTLPDQPAMDTAVCEPEQQIEMWSPQLFSGVPTLDWPGTSASASTDPNQIMVSMEYFGQHVLYVQRLEEQINDMAKFVLGGTAK
jgi:hypothetical protein